MRLNELRKTLNRADPAAVLVHARVFKRVIQQVWNLPTLLWKVPHSGCFVVDRHILFRYVEQEELDLEPEQMLPPTVILLPRPTAEELADNEANLLQTYWRRLFHANVHRALDERKAEKALTPYDFQTRIEKIGLAEFDEIRTVLQQEHFLEPRADEATAYIEFAAVYLELKFFATNLRPVYFPGLGSDFARIDRLLAEDVNYDELFSRTRLPDAAAPQTSYDMSSDLSHERYWAMIHEAEAESRLGNMVRGALLRSRAARIAPPQRIEATRAEAHAELERLTDRLKGALQLNDQEAAAWLQDLDAILDKASDDNSSEAGLLFDLQNVCLDSEQDICAIDPVEWVLSGFRRPIKRPLHGQKPVRVLKHLRHALQRLSMLRLSDQDRHHLSSLLKSAVSQCEERIRARFRPLLTDAVNDVDLKPSNPPERVAFTKMIEEMLDRIVAYGYLTFSELRDAISRNQLKLPDLEVPREIIRGDALLRLDRRLAILLDGVYRPSEVYMRLLEKVSALNFGTTAGRALTRYITIPFGGAFVLVEAVELLVTKFGVPPLLPIPYYCTIWVVGLFLLGLMHVERFRRRCLEITRQIYEPVQALAADVVRKLPLSALGRILTSWPCQLLYWFVLKPLGGCALLWLRFPELRDTWLEAVITFLAMNFVLNLRPVVAFEEAFWHICFQFYADVRAGLLPGLFRFIVRVFKQITDSMEYVMFSVDEWLRFRSGAGTLPLVARAVLSVVWYPISYFARFYIVVLIEPGINPIKFPICSVAYKFMLPFQLQWTEGLIGLLTPIFGAVLAKIFAVPTVWLLADAFGFLFWETKENWSLFRANRSTSLRPVGIGPHGESLRGLLRPGFHSGTIPRLFTRLRAAEVEACRTGNWHVARSLRQSLDEVQRIVRQFVAHDFVSLLRQSASWRDEVVDVGKVELSYNRIRTEVTNDRFRDRPVWIEFEERAGWFIAGIQEKGWLSELNDEQQRALTTALASLYKLAGVTLVREQVKAQLTPAVASFDVTPESLIVHIDGVADRSVTYELNRQGDYLKASNNNGVRSKDRPTLDRRRVIFADTPISREEWAESWQRDQDGKGHPQLAVAGEELVLTEKIAISKD
jgi:hypothetical protein